MFGSQDPGSWGRIWIWGWLKIMLVVALLWLPYNLPSSILLMRYQKPFWKIYSMNLRISKTKTDMFYVKLQTSWHLHFNNNSFRKICFGQNSLCLQNAVYNVYNSEAHLHENAEYLRLALFINFYVCFLQHTSLCRHHI